MHIGLHARQMTALESPANEILYGGAAGGGKSFLMRAAAIALCSDVAGLQVYIFRRIRDDLIKNHVEGPKGFRALLGDWVDAGRVQIVEDEIRFDNGSKIYLCHCKDAKDVYKYQGAEIHLLLIDELTHWEEKMYRFLRNRVRMVGVDVPERWAGSLPKILCASNPGNIGHQWVKATFIDGVVPEEIRQTDDDEGGMLRQFIPAQLDDNPSMQEDDPKYEKRLMGLGSEALVKAMRYGDWNVVEGAFFDKWSHKNVIKPFAIPDQWIKIRGLDWGYAKPFSVGWWAVCGEDFWHDESQCLIPRGALIRYREWYGCTGRPDQGLRLDVEEVAYGIIEREREKISYGVADPSIKAHKSGKSDLERFMECGLSFRMGDNTRVAKMGTVAGWNHVRERIRGTEDGFPMLFVFDTCVDFIRTVPVLQHDPDKPEDLDTGMEDHIADETRYVCASRPYMNQEREQKRVPSRLQYEVKPDGTAVANMSVREIVEQKMRRKRRTLH